MHNAHYNQKEVQATGFSDAGQISLFEVAVQFTIADSPRTEIAVNVRICFSCAKQSELAVEPFSFDV